MSSLLPFAKQASLKVVFQIKVHRLLVFVLSSRKQKCKHVSGLVETDVSTSQTVFGKNYLCNHYLNKCAKNTGVHTSNCPWKKLFVSPLLYLTQALHENAPCGARANSLPYNGAATKQPLRATTDTIATRSAYLCQ